MKKEYISPTIKTEALTSKDVLITSTPDNENLQASPNFNQSTLFSSIVDFVFDLTNNGQ